MPSEHVTKTIFVKNLDQKLTSSELEDHFSEYGPLIKAFVVTEKGSKKSRGFGYVTFALKEDCDTALSLCKDIKGRRANLSLALKRPSQEQRSGDLPKQKPAAVKYAKKHMSKRYRLIIRNLSFKADNSQLKKVFEPFGEIIEVQIPTLEGGRKRGFGFVEFKDPKAAVKALAKVNKTQILGRPVAVDWAVDKNKYTHLAEEADDGDDDDEADVKSDDGDDEQDSEAESAGDDEDDDDEDDDDEEDMEVDEDDTGLEAVDETSDDDDDVEPQEPADDDDDDDDEDDDEMWLQKSVGAKDKVKSRKRKHEVDNDSKKNKKRRKQEEEQEMEEESDSDDDKLYSLNLGKQDEESDDEDDDDDDDVKEDDMSDDDEDDDNIKQGDMNDDIDDEDDDDEDDLDDDGSEWKKPHRKPKQSSDVDQGLTVFVRNVPFDAEDEDLDELFSAFGPVSYALVVMDHISGHSKGTAFVKFRSISSIEKCLETAKDPDKAEMLTLKSRQLSVTLALSKEKAKAVQKPKEIIDDNRNLWLAREGMIRPGSKAAEALSETDINKRKKVELVKRQKLKNPNIFVSPTRLCLHNLPLKVTDKELRTLCIKAGGVKARVTECRIMRDLENIGKDGVARSRGYAFVTFTEHSNAMKALHHMNNNAKLFGPNRKPIVEFSLENKLALLAKERRKQKSQGSKQAAPAVKPSNKKNKKKVHQVVPRPANKPKALPSHFGAKKRHKKKKLNKKGK